MEARRMRIGRSLKERLGFKGVLGWCGSSWGFGPPNNISVADDDEEAADHVVIGRAAEGEQQIADGNGVDLTCDDSEIPPISASISAVMSLATALAAERHSRATESGGAPEWGESPLKVSLMRLLEEGDGDGDEEQTGGGGVGVSACCCVCMGRRKGAAFIPCGHTFCRVCSRELWLNRGCCPLCNRHILDILDIF